MKLEGDIVVDIESLHMMTLLAVEGAVEAVCCSLAALHIAMVFGRTGFADRVADVESMERAAEGSDNHRAVMTQVSILDLWRPNRVLASWMDKAADCLVAGNDNPPWLKIV